MKTIFRTPNYPVSLFNKENILSSDDIYSFKLKGSEMNTRTALSVVYKKNKEQKTVLDGVKVLLVEDDKINRLIVATILKRQNVNLTKANNGVEAIEILKNKDFDLILMDIQMPIMNGIDATNIIRKELKIETPIIALTANSFTAEIDEVIQVGMNDYLTKPFEEQDLINIIEKHHRIYSNIKLRTIESTINKAEFKILYDLKKLEKMSKGNINFIKKMCALFVKITPDHLKKMNSSYEQRNINDLKKLAHKMKPSVDYMGIESLKQDINDLEHLNKDDYSAKKLKSLIENIVNILLNVVVQLERRELS